jgi:small GTP-binding protein
MLGEFAVGKTSLVRQFVYSIFSDTYQTTIGVKIDKKTVPLEDGDIELILWDINGEDDFMEVKNAYLRGAAGCIFVIDGTRPGTIQTARRLKQKSEQTIGMVPHIIVANKYDLVDQWEITENDLMVLNDAYCTIKKTSAKTGSGVEETFMELARMIMEP